VPPPGSGQILLGGQLGRVGTAIAAVSAGLSAVGS
jgi:hypothetical protein